MCNWGVPNYTLLNLILKRFHVGIDVLHVIILVQRFHVGVDVLNVIVLIKTLHDLVDGLALLGSYILQVIGDAGELGGLYLESILLKPLLDCGV